MLKHLDSCTFFFYALFAETKQTTSFFKERNVKFLQVMCVNHIDIALSKLTFTLKNIWNPSYLVPLVLFVVLSVL
jgi:hypothetical protein